MVLILSRRAGGLSNLSKRCHTSAVVELVEVAHRLHDRLGVTPTWFRQVRRCGNFDDSPTSIRMVRSDPTAI